MHAGRLEQDLELLLLSIYDLQSEWVGR